MVLTTVLMHLIPFMWLAILSCWLLRCREKIVYICALFVAIGFIPLFHLNVAEYIRGFFGVFSISSMLLAFYIIYQYMFSYQLSSNSSFNLTMITLCVFSLLLYGCNITAWSSWDIYALGYQLPGALIIILLLAMVIFALGNYLLAILTICVLYGYYFDICGWGNIWNYCCDPFIGLFSLIYVCRMVWMKVFWLRQYHSRERGV